MRFPQAKQGISRDLAGILWISCSSPHTERVFASFRNGNDSQQGISRELAGIFARESAGEKFPVKFPVNSSPHLLFLL
jgi:hypothetical protein